MSANLCLAGGVALNCVANGKLQKEKVYSTRSGYSLRLVTLGEHLGAALAAWHQHEGGARTELNGYRDHMQGAYLGPSFFGSSHQDKP